MLLAGWIVSPVTPSRFELSAALHAKRHCRSAGSYFEVIKRTLSMDSHGRLNLHSCTVHRSSGVGGASTPARRDVSNDSGLCVSCADRVVVGDAEASQYTRLWAPINAGGRTTFFASTQEGRAAQEGALSRHGRVVVLLISGTKTRSEAWPYSNLFS